MTTQAEQNLLHASDLDRNSLEQALGAIHHHQNDYADLYFQSSQNESWVLEDGIICIVYRNGFDRCDMYVRSGGRLVVLTEDGERYPVRPDQ